MRLALRQLRQTFRIGFSASNMARPETPSTSATTFASLMLAVSSSLCTRLAAWTRSRMRLFRCRVSAHVADRWRRDEASDESMREQVRDPLAVLHIGLPARHGLHVVRIDQDYLKAPFKEVEDRFPVHACGLHRHVCARRVRQPLVKPEQLGGRHAESSHLGLRRPWCSRRHAVTDSL